MSDLLLVYTTWESVEQAKKGRKTFIGEKALWLCKYLSGNDFDVLVATKRKQA